MNKTLTIEADYKKFGLLLHATFIEACRKKFRHADVVDVIRYIADIRMRSQDIAIEVNPDDTEFIIRNALGDDQVSGDLSDERTAGTQL